MRQQVPSAVVAFSSWPCLGYQGEETASSSWGRRCCPLFISHPYGLKQCCWRCMAVNVRSTPSPGLPSAVFPHMWRNRTRKAKALAHIVPTLYSATISSFPLKSPSPPKKRNRTTTPGWFMNACSIGIIWLVACGLWITGPWGLSHSRRAKWADCTFLACAVQCDSLCPRVALENLKCDWSKLRCPVSTKYTSDFKDRRKKQNLLVVMFLYSSQVGNDISLIYQLV